MNVSRQTVSVGLPQKQRTSWGLDLKSFRDSENGGD